jgi:hypothetical protein
VCAIHIRGVCPAFAAIKQQMVHFNAATRPPGTFNIRTSTNQNTQPGQAFVRCIGDDSEDEYTPRDRPQMFAPFPAPSHAGAAPMTVDSFIQTY